MQNSVIAVGVYGSIKQPNSQTFTEKHDVFRKAHQALTKEIPSSRAALEAEFRKMLGASGGSPDPAPRRAASRVRQTRRAVSRS